MRSLAQNVYTLRYICVVCWMEYISLETQRADFLKCMAFRDCDEFCAPPLCCIYLCCLTFPSRLRHVNSLDKMWPVNKTTHTHTLPGHQMESAILLYVYTHRGSRSQSILPAMVLWKCSTALWVCSEHAMWMSVCERATRNIEFVQTHQCHALL